MPKNQNLFKKLPYKSLRYAALNAIRNSIMNGGLKPGQRLVESDISQQLGISRSPVREALHQLEIEGLVTSSPNMGTYVTKLSLKDLREIYTIRAALEQLAVKLVTYRVNEEELAELEKLVEDMHKSAQVGNLNQLTELDMTFHRYLCHTSHNKRLFDIWLTMNAQIRLFINLTAHFYLPAKEIVKRHKNVVKAIRENRAEEAGRLISNDIIELGKKICDQYKLNNQIEVNKKL